jgi:hypothetical protein
MEINRATRNELVTGVEKVRRQIIEALVTDELIDNNEYRELWTLGYADAANADCNIRGTCPDDDFKF